ncbi:hypothetical protein BGZ94_000773 [Podila epigama]|nr:hypothetical protein BGZ94_000773 [Podila epigama]
MQGPLPSRFLRITGSKNKLVRQLEQLRTDSKERRVHGRVLIQGIKTIQELASKGHTIGIMGITFDETNLPIREPALSVVKHWIKKDETKKMKGGDGGHRDGTSTNAGSVFEAEQFVAVSRSMTTRILGTDSKTSEHEVWATVQIPDFRHLFSTSTSTQPTLSTLASKTKGDGRRTVQSIERMLLLDQIKDPGNMGLMVRAGMAMGWDGTWSTPGTVDMYNDKVVRASRAHCLEWPNHVGGWSELAVFLAQRKITLAVADMFPTGALSQDALPGSTERIAALKSNGLDLTQLVWWNWPSSLPKSRLPERLALVMSSEHHGVQGQRKRQHRGKPDPVSVSASSITRPGQEQDDSQHQQADPPHTRTKVVWDEEQKAKAHLLKNAIRVSIPMHPAVESMNVATAATTMMWEVNRLHANPTSKLQIVDLS